MAGRWMSPKTQGTARGGPPRPDRSGPGRRPGCATRAL